MRRISPLGYRLHCRSCDPVDGLAQERAVRPASTVGRAKLAAVRPEPTTKARIKVPRRGRLCTFPEQAGNSGRAQGSEARVAHLADRHRRSLISEVQCAAAEHHRPAGCGWGEGEVHRRTEPPDHPQSRDGQERRDIREEESGAQPRAGSLGNICDCGHDASSARLCGTGSRITDEHSTAGRALDRVSNHKDRSVRPVRCSAWLVGGCFAAAVRTLSSNPIRQAWGQLTHDLRTHRAPSVLEYRRRLAGTE